MGGIVGIACANGPGALFGLFVAMFHIGLLTFAIGLGVWAVARQEHPTISYWSRMRLLLMAQGVEQDSGISGNDYGRFLIMLERLRRQGMLTHNERDQIIATLKNLVLKKGRRISGLDYVELEKKLLKAGTVKINDKNVELFSKLHIERILEDYEKLRKRIRDRRLMSF